MAQVRYEVAISTGIIHSTSLGYIFTLPLYLDSLCEQPGRKMENRNSFPSSVPQCTAYGCARDATPGYKTCKECRAINRSYRQQHRARQKGHETPESNPSVTCWRCKQGHPIPGYRWCQECHDACMEMKDNNTLCSHCKSRKVIPGAKQCETCRTQTNSRYATRKSGPVQCKYCNLRPVIHNVSGENKSHSSTRWCEQCRDDFHARGICSVCKKGKPVYGFRTCHACRLRARRNPEKPSSRKSRGPSQPGEQESDRRPAENSYQGKMSLSYICC